MHSIIAWTARLTAATAANRIGGTATVPHTSLALLLLPPACAAALCSAHPPVMLAGLRPRAATLICTAAYRRTAASMSVAKLSYPAPLVFKSAAEHKSTLIMLHGLGEQLCS